MKEDLIKRMEVRLAKRLDHQMRVLKKEMSAEMAFLEDKLRAEMEKEIAAVKKSLGESEKN